MPRTVNPATAYRLVPHATHGHVYASVQRTVAGKDGKNVRRHKHYGVLDGNKSTPWAEFLVLLVEERAKFVFPPPRVGPEPSGQAVRQARTGAPRP